MIVSVHVPKTAGTSFGERLSATFGDRLLRDYGDWVGNDSSEAVERRSRRAADMRAQRDELLQNIDVIHGHFVADKYLGLFPATEFIAFFRDPYQQAVSNYWYLMRHPEIDHPSVRDFHRDKPTITDFVASRPNVLSVFLGRLAVEDLAAVGITESYDRSIALMEKILGRALAPGSARLNVNPERRSEFYAIDASVREAVDLHQAGDVELYRRASERFAALVSRYDI